MKKYISTLFFTFLLLIGYSQSLKTIKIKTPNPAKTKEIFQVLKANPEIKNGTYKKYKYKQLIEKGVFKNNQKDSTWNIYSQSGKLTATGNYRNDKKIGIWKYYSKNGILVQKYNYDSDSLVYFDVTEEKKYGYAPSIYPDTAQQQMPIFIGGTNYMYTQLENNIMYPKAAWNKTETAKVTVSFVVDTLGNTTEVKSMQQVGEGFDEEAVNIVTSFGIAWIPGIQRGKKVRVQYSLPISFKLN